MRPKRTNEIGSLIVDGCEGRPKRVSPHIHQVLVASAKAMLVAISPQTPDNSLSTTEKHELTFEVLSDVGNQVARKFGLVFTVPETLRPIYQAFGMDIPAANGDQTFELPIPATYVINPDGTIAYAFVNLDYTQRQDPEGILTVLKNL